MFLRGDVLRIVPMKGSNYIGGYVMQPERRSRESGYVSRQSLHPMCSFMRQENILDKSAFWVPYKDAYETRFLFLLASSTDFILRPSPHQNHPGAK